MVLGCTFIIIIIITVVNVLFGWVS